MKAFVREGFDGFFDVLITEGDGDHKVVLKPIEFEFVPIRRGEFLPPSMRLPYEMAQALVAAFDGKGIKPDAVSIAEGKLEATEYHLEDLRKLLKLPPQPTVTITKSVQS